VVLKFGEKDSCKASKKGKKQTPNQFGTHKRRTTPIPSNREAGEKETLDHRRAMEKKERENASTKAHG